MKKIIIDVEKIENNKTLYNGKLSYIDLNITFNSLSLLEILEKSKTLIINYLQEQNIKLEPKEISYYFKFKE